MNDITGRLDKSILSVGGDGGHFGQCTAYIKASSSRLGLALSSSVVTGWVGTTVVVKMDRSDMYLVGNNLGQPDQLYAQWGHTQDDNTLLCRL